ncbi:MAG: UPF0104 family protein [Planctomycetota bacterium]|nr:MAG: UPF0104 family protein [Planctomycetota bacterium]
MSGIRKFAKAIGLSSIGMTFLKIGLAAVLMWYVISQIETRDRLVEIPPDDGPPVVLAYGDLQGEWQEGGEWQFQPEDESQPPVRSQDLKPNQEPRPGFFTLLAGLRVGFYAAAIGFWMVLLSVVTWRWQILLRAAGVTTGYFNAMRLCFIGYFFNNAMPGLTGGDLVRAVLVTRGLESNRTKAAMSVIVDRLIGLFSLVLLAGLVLAFGDIQGADGQEIRHLDTVAQGVFLFLLAAVIGGCVYLSRRIRRWVRLDKILGILPAKGAISKLDDAVTVYRSHPGAVLTALVLSLILQACGVMSFWAVGKALGAELEVAHDFVIFPVVQTISSIPLTPPAGWGVGETLYGKFFEWFGSAFTLGVAVSVLFRLTTQMGFGLVGGLVWVLSREKKQGMKLAEMKDNGETETSE